ncbi:MAG: GNAT family N-acetyltransferase [Thermomicrobiales bacterium]
MTSVNVREATLNDIDELAALLVAFNAGHARNLPQIYLPVAADAETNHYVRRVMALPRTHLFVAETAGQVVGALILQQDEVPQTPVHVPRQWVTINVVVVREGYRRRGIGRALMEHARTWAGENGIDTVELIVAEFNTAAMAWYESLGFTTRERRMAWTRDDGQDWSDT